MWLYIFNLWKDFTNFLFVSATNLSTASKKSILKDIIYDLFGIFVILSFNIIPQNINDVFFKNFWNYFIFLFKTVTSFCYVFKILNFPENWIISSMVPLDPSDDFLMPKSAFWRFNFLLQIWPSSASANNNKQHMFFVSICTYLPNFFFKVSKSAPEVARLMLQELQHI